MKKQIFIILMLLMDSMYGFSQNQNIQGKVISQDGSLLAGATVKAILADKSTITNARGKFSLSVEGNDTLAISYVGYETTRIPIKPGHNPGIIILNPSIGSLSLSEVVVTGYETQRKADLTGSVAIANIKDIQNLPNNNPMQALQGRVPGLYVTSDGDPSGSPSTISVRGFNTLGFTAPLYVIDGVSTIDPSVFQSLDPSSIASIQVLKDASSESIYGSRASNGVIIVTTKQGTKGKVRVQFSSNLTTEKYVTRTNVLSSEGMGKAIWQAAINDGSDPNSITSLFSYVQHTGTNGNPVLDKINITPFLGGDSTEPAANTDWQNVMFHPGTITSNSLTITSGSDNSSLLINLNYLNNSGLIVDNSGYRRYGARVNASTRMLKGKVKFGNNLQFFQSSETPIPSDLGGAGLTYDAIFVSPLIPVYTTTGAFGGPQGSGFSDRDNPLATMSTNSWNRNNEFNLFGNLFLEVDPIKNLVFNSNLGYLYDNTYQRQILQEYSDGFISRKVNSLSINQGNELDLTWSNTLNYHLSTGLSRVDFLLGTEAIKRTYNTQGDYKQGFAIQNNNYFYLNAGTGITTNSGTSTGNQLLSFFGKINYAWSDKYLASVTIRRDGSSRFGSDNRYGVFPAGSLGWVISNEPFLKNVNFITNLKLRSGVGVTGNQEIGDEASVGLYQTNYGTLRPGDCCTNTGTAYDISGVGTGNLQSGYVSVQAANPNLKWESTLGFNEGIDFGFLNNKIFGSFDYFSRKTTNILIQPPYAGVEGEGQTQWVNGASMSNKGWEFVLGYQNKIGQLSYSINGNVFSFRDKITYLPASVISAYPGDVQQTILGHAPTEMFGYVTQGIFQNQAEVNGHATQSGDGVGRLIYKDLNNNGQIDALDQTWLGNQLPKLNYGLMVNLEYKSFSFSFFLQGVQGVKVGNGNKAATDFVGLNPGVNFGSRTLDAWTPENTKSTIPALSLVDNNDEGRFASYFVESGSYMKLRNMELGYIVPSKDLQNLGVDQLKVYLMGENLLTIKKTHGSDAFTGPDPETPGSYYPIPRKLTIGVNLSF